MLDGVGMLVLGIAGVDGKIGKKKRRNPEIVIGNVAMQCFRSPPCPTL